MSSTKYRWSLVAVLACATGLALSAAPALAHPDDDKDTSGGKAGKEIRVYTDGDDDDAPDIRVYTEGDDDRDADPGERKVIRVYSDRDDDDDSPGDHKTFRMYHGGDWEQEAAAPGGFLGVRVQDVTRELQKAKELPNTDGALISRVEPGSPAARAGIKKGDVIVEVGHNQIDESSELIRRVRNLEPGDKVPVVVLRDGMRKTLTVTVGKRPKEFSYVMPRRGPNWIGMAEGDLPDMKDLGPQLDRIRVYRQDIQRQLTDIQEQLSRLREGEIQRLEDEIRALRDELRARDDKRAPRPD